MKKVAKMKHGQQLNERLGDDGTANKVTTTKAKKATLVTAHHEQLRKLSNLVF